MHPRHNCGGAREPRASRLPRSRTWRTSEGTLQTAACAGTSRGSAPCAQGAQTCKQRVAASVYVRHEEAPRQVCNCSCSHAPPLAKHHPACLYSPRGHDGEAARVCCSKRLAAARPTAADSCIREAPVVARVARCGGVLVHVWRLPTPAKLTTSVRGHICPQGASAAALHTSARAPACTYLGTSTKGKHPIRP